MTNRQAIAFGLAHCGARVAYVETTGGRPSRRSAEFEWFFDGAIGRILVARPRPWLPFSGKPLSPSMHFRAMLSTAFRRNLEASLEGPLDLVITYDPLSGPWLATLSPSTSVYDCVDLYEEQPTYNHLLARRPLLAREHRLARQVDMVTATAPGLVPKFLDYGVEAHVLLGSIPPPQWANQALSKDGNDFVYVGALDPYKVDLHALLKLATEHSAKGKLHIVGGNELSTTHSRALHNLLTHPNVEYHGPLGRGDLWGVLSRCTVGIVAMTRSRYSAASFPLKTWDYLWAGLHVIGLHADSLKGLSSHVQYAGSRDDFVAMVGKALDARNWDVTARQGRRDFARAHSSYSRARRLLSMTEGS